MAKTVSQQRSTGGTAVAEVLDPLRVVAQLPLRPYHRLADLFSGDGSLTIAIAKHTFDGTVYATDSSSRSRDALRERLAQVRLSNVVVYDPKEESKVVEPGSLDGVVMVLGLSGSEERAAALKRASLLLKKGAWAAVAEWHKRETGGLGPPVEKRLGEDEAAALAAEAGFRVSQRRDLSGRCYLLVLRK